MDSKNWTIRQIRCDLNANCIRLLLDAAFQNQASKHITAYNFGSTCDAESNSFLTNKFRSVFESVQNPPKFVLDFASHDQARKHIRATNLGPCETQNLMHCSRTSSGMCWTGWNLYLILRLKMKPASVTQQIKILCR